MTFSIGMYFDKATEQEIRRIWQAVAAGGKANYLYHSGDRPHITLAIMETLDLQQASHILREIASEWQVMEVSFQSIGIFPSTTAVFLAPVPTPGLLRLQKDLRIALEGFTQFQDSPYFLPGKWVPHCSIAIEFPAASLPGVVHQVLDEVHLPLNGLITAIGVTSFHPVQQLVVVDLVS